jgi:glycosyltransferase involved in cell wall biosynthesis
VIPVFNEAASLHGLFEEVGDALLGLDAEYEILFVDDGSTDASLRILEELAAKDPAVKLIAFRRNCGQTAAMMAGIEYAQGDVIVVMDGDGQNDPADIPRLLGRLSAGFDVVSGWRRERKDARWRRVLPSRIANALISWISGVRLHDYGCSLKAYRADVIRAVRLYGEMHRFAPIYASWQGARVAELPVNHRPREHGESKYGLERVGKVLLDLLVVWFLGRYETRPMYVFGGFGFVCWGISLASGSYAVWRKLFDATSFIQTPLPLLSVMAFITGVLSILMGLLAELLVRTYYESQQRRPYSIRSSRNLEPEQREA